MNRYMMIHRLRGPLFLLLLGILALLAQAHIFGWSKSWPLFFIFWGVMLLAERAVLAFEGGNRPWPLTGQYPPGYYPGTPQQSAADAVVAAAQEHTAEQQVVNAGPASEQEPVKENNEPEGRQS